MTMRIILALSLLLSACAYCGDQPLITITGGTSSGGSFDPGATNAVLESAIHYADTIATDAFFEACIYAGSVAGDAERNSKAYSDTNLNTAKAYSDANLVAAKGYSDANLATAKGYSDENLRTSKGYADTTASAAALTACNDAKAYADQNLNLAKGYSDTNLNAAKGYADSSATAAAASAVVEAKAYADQDLILAKGYSDNNLVTAKGYSDNNLIASKGYTDNTLSYALGYSDANYIASKVYSDTNTLARAEDFSLDVLDYSKIYSNTNTLVRAKDHADAAKASAISTASADATTKSGNALKFAKAYADTNTLVSAKAYADSNLNAARSYADFNLAAAKGYSDSNLNSAKGYSDANLLTAKGYSDANLVTAKDYSDINLNTAKSYTDTKLQAYDLGDRGWIGAVKLYSQQLGDYVPLSTSSPVLLTPTETAGDLYFTVSSQVPGLFLLDLYTSASTSSLSVTFSDSSSFAFYIKNIPPVVSDTSSTPISSSLTDTFFPNTFFLRITFSPTSVGGSGQPNHKDSIVLVYYFSSYNHIQPVIVNDYI